VVVDGALEAIPQLMAVLVLVLFSFLLFGIMGVQLFAGLFHARCRLTPHPVTFAWVPGLNYSDYR
jgi:Mg2+/citrate symporter